MGLRSELKKILLSEVEGHVPQCPITGDANDLKNKYGNAAERVERAVSGV